MKRTVEIRYKNLKNYKGKLNLGNIFEIITSNGLDSASSLIYDSDLINNKIMLTEEFKTYIDKNLLSERQMKKLLIPFFGNIKITKVKIKEEC